MDSHEKGRQGELLVRSALQSAFRAAPLFSNLIIPATDGLTQIDHVLITSAGVFVIEVKKYAGEILGSPDAPFWMQFVGNRKTEFQNPIHQNARHVSALRCQLGFRDSLFHSIVVFVGRVELLRPVSANVLTTIAAGCSKLIEHIRTFPDQQITASEIAQATHHLTRLQAAGFTEEDLLRSIRERRSKAQFRERAWQPDSPRTFLLPRTESRRAVRRQSSPEEPLLQVARWAFRNL